MPNPHYSTRNRQTGTTIHLLDGNLEENDWWKDPNNRWVIVCQEHGESKAYAKQNDAYKGMTDPTWCTACKVLMVSGTKVLASKITFEEYAAQRAGSSTEQSTGALSPQTDPESDVATPPEVSEVVFEDSEPEDASSNLVQSTSERRGPNNTCYKCGGVLKADAGPPGHFHSVGLPGRDVCCACAGHVVDAEA